jgi:hypothetical protein
MSKNFRFWFVDELYHREPLLAATGLFMGALMIPTAFALLVETRTLADVNLWEKPLKFQAALLIYLLTLAFFAKWLPAGMRETRWYRIYAAIVIACIVYEVAIIMFAASLGVRSHFNNSTPLWTANYMLMGTAAVFLTSATLVYGIAINRNGASGLPPAIKISLVYGLVLTFVLTLIVALKIGSTGSHLVGGNLSDAEAARSLDGHATAATCACRISSRPMRCTLFRSSDCCRLTCLAVIKRGR